MEQYPTSKVTSSAFEDQFKRISEVKNPGRYLIACEGTKDEPKYIMDFVKAYRIRANVVVAEREEGDFGSNPLHVVQVLIDNLNRVSSIDIRNSIKPWIMIDRDKDREKELKSTKKICVDNSYGIAYSSPCIELWFLLHYKDLSKLNNTTQSQILVPKKMKKHLKKYFIDIANGFVSLFPQTQIAIDRARRIDKPGIDFPTDFCTRVYLLISELLEFR